MSAGIADQSTTLGALASILQLTAGIALAMSVFRAPYENLYHKLGMILDREEAILKGRSDSQAAISQVEKVLAARVEWLSKGRELEPEIALRELWIWGAVLLSAIGLVATALWPDLPLKRWTGFCIIACCTAPLAIGIALINGLVRHRLSVVREQIHAL